MTEEKPEKFECYGVPFEAPLEPVIDRDGEMMPYNPEFDPDDFNPNPTGVSTGPFEWWCWCQHLVVDHHFDPKRDKSDGLMLECWAVGCPCEHRMGD